ncbi:Primase C terminal 2 (PriCT-2) [Cyclobacterium lianum]|uniref:Primase C terminal 2 (PriCT-2) n=1 Tax=Cyclobacterium lianum TaxID=388280 RepID=A0A1M7M747_9BACT|nr:DUF3987 domain-containing protein [Cyclobacterium lianum]SHM86564.1 Primase C terminal 2 (PriCT-2) [Cyclobacterium lianum]
MERKTFNPLEWLDKPDQPVKVTEQSNYNTTTQLEDVERIIQDIEASRIDVTSAYSDWVNIGFAFADEFGETGRNLFHRVSQFHPEYSIQECDKQFDNCMKARGQGVSLKTFFFHAKQAGIPLATPKQERQDYSPASKSEYQSKNLNTQAENKKEPDLMPTFPNSLFPELPEFLQKVIQIATSNEERDILLLGSLVAISACLPKVSGIYDGKRVYSNLFLFITAQASAGKGRLVHCRQLVNPVHKEFREQAKLHKQHYELELAEYNANKGKVEGIEKPEKPPEKMLFIPANNSSTGAYQLLGDSDGKGLIFETEGDTLAHAFKSDYGNYSDGFRKAFHHETISYYRRTDREYVDIESPCLSTVLSGTPKQVAALIPNAENGLFSRFIFYYMNVRPVWKNVFASQTTNGLDDYFDTLGNEFFNLYSSLKAGQDVQFFLTADQQDQFNQFFGQIQEKYMSIQGIDYMATIRRLGLIAYRFCMIFSALRIMETGETSSKMICEERDFQASLAMVKVLVKHSSKVFAELPEDVQKPTRLNRKEKFLNKLPKHFNRQKYLEVAAALSIPHKTAEGYITDFCKSGLLHRESQDNYINTSIEDTQDSEDAKEN